MRFSLLLVAMVAGCGSTPSAEPPVAVEAVKSAEPAVTASASVAVVAAPLPKTLDRTCKELEAENRSQVAGSAFAYLDRPELPQGMPAAKFGQCIRGARGAWALVLTAHGEDPPGENGCWALVHVDEHGGRAVTFPGAHGGASASCSPKKMDLSNLIASPFNNSVGFEAPRLFDFDGDGEPEIWIPRHGAQLGTEVEGDDSLFTFHDGVVEVYGPAKHLGIADLRDVDGDGRPDLITYGPYRTDSSARCGLSSMSFNPVRGPELVGHSLADGTFSLTDKVAHDFVASECVVRPNKISEGKEIVCELLHGTIEAGIDARLSDCGPQCGGAEPCCPEWCEQSRSWVHSFAVAKVPIHL